LLGAKGLNGVFLVAGMALGLGEPEKPNNKFKKKVIVSSAVSKKTDDCELIFSLDEDHVVTENSAGAPNLMQYRRTRPRSPLKIKTPQSKPHHVSLLKCSVCVYNGC
jgi:hypothetical protein